jgi:hypothetical protein
MKIAFVGDSFCMNYDRGSIDWPAVVAGTLGAEILQTGFGGQPFYPSVELFLSDNFYKADYVVMCPTEPYRIYNIHNLPINGVWVDQITNKKGDHWAHIKSGYYEEKYNIPNKVLVKEITAGAKAYYDHFMTNTYAKMTNIALITWLDNLLKEHNKKVIWLPSFYHSFLYSSLYCDFVNQEPLDPIHPDVYYVPVSGPSANIPLFDISKAELEQHSLLNLNEEEINDKVANDQRHNHFNKENNGIIAKMVLDIIEKDDFSPKAIHMEEYFSHLDLSNIKRVR